MLPPRLTRPPAGLRDPATPPSIPRPGKRRHSIVRTKERNFLLHTRKKSTHFPPPPHVLGQPRSKYEVVLRLQVQLDTHTRQFKKNLSFYFGLFLARGRCNGRWTSVHAAMIFRGLRPPPFVETPASSGGRWPETAGARGCGRSGSRLHGFVGCARAWADGLLSPLVPVRVPSPGVACRSTPMALDACGVTASWKVGDVSLLRRTMVSRRNPPQCN